MSKVNEIKEALLKGNVIFTIKGNNDYDRDEEGNWGWNTPREIYINRGSSIVSDLKEDSWTTQMNISEFTDTSIKCFTYNFLGTRVASTIKYKDITILDKKKHHPYHGEIN